MEQQNKIWEVTDIFSLAELKRSTTNFKDFGRGVNNVDKCDLLLQRGPFCQALAFTLECVLLYHARNGVLRNKTAEATNATAETNMCSQDENNAEMGEKPEGDDTIKPGKTFPLAVISGIIAGTDSAKQSDLLRWVSGGLLFPHACGDPFNYCVKSYGRFHEDLEAETKSIEMALSLLFETLLFGLRAARRVLRDRVGQPYQPDPMSGMHLMIGEQQLDFPILTNPIPRPEYAAGQKRGYRSMEVSQAEFFHGVLNVPKILETSELHRNIFFQFCNDNKEVPVLIKVSSMAVYPFLVHPSKILSALRAAKEVLASPRKSSRESNEGGLVAGPLLAAISKGTGMITIMADLSKQEYGSLKPESTFPTQLSTVWEGFKDLVIGVLLPLADCGVIHADIRPDYDFTANILVKRSDDGMVRMELVDFDSLVDFTHWDISSIGYIKKANVMWTAFTFVWWQCIFVAYAWLGERGIYRTSEDADFQAKIGKLEAQGSAKAAAFSQLEEKSAPKADAQSLQTEILTFKWLPASVRAASSKHRMNEQSVKTSLAELDRVFYLRDLYRQSTDKETTLDALAADLAKMEADEELEKQCQSEE